MFQFKSGVCNEPHEASAKSCILLLLNQYLGGCFMASFNEISVSTLARLIGTPECPVLLDVRIDEDFDAEPRLIPGAYRISHSRVCEAVAQLQNKSVVVYCQKGLKLSQGAAALLRCEGVKAEVLQGGQYAWRDSSLPMVEASKIPEIDTQGRTTWVTKHRPKIDRIAWLAVKIWAQNCIQSRTQLVMHRCS